MTTIPTRASILLVSILSATSHAMWAGYVKTPEEYVMVSPQAGLTSDHTGSLMVGGTASYYKKIDEKWFIGGGCGSYLQGEDWTSELLFKGSILGLAGASIGPSITNRKIGFTNDFWLNAIFVGLRWRIDYNRKTTQSLNLFVPLWWLFQ